MKYILMNNLISGASKKAMYLTTKETGNFIYLTEKEDEAKTFNSIEELDKYAKEKKLKKKDFTVVTLK